MDKKEAARILGISPNEWSPESVKRAYKTQALKYHPDKNRAEDAAERFREIHEAYVYLNGTDENRDYMSLLKEFCKTWMDERIVYGWLLKITMICEEKSLLLLQNIDKQTLKQIYELLVRHQDILHITPDFMEKMKEVIKTRFENDERIILHPFLDDLWENNLYKLVIHETTFLVPLWHHHLIYDAGDNTEIYVDCIPLLPDYVIIDEYNNIHVEIQLDLQEIWKEEILTVYAGSKPFFIKRGDLKITPKQTKIIPNEGIARINTNYEMIKKSDVYFHISIDNDSGF